MTAGKNVASVRSSKSEAGAPTRKSMAKPSVLVLLLSCWLLYSIAGPYAPSLNRLWPSKSAATRALCTQVEPILPNRTTKQLQIMDEYLLSKSFERVSIVTLSGAVQIPTESFDDLGAIGEDKRWDIMYEFAAYIQKTFPHVHYKLKLEKVNTHGLLYTWQGSVPSLKPTLLMAHQDVVPVAESTIDSWTYPPYSGYFDGHFVWGRGSMDCKNQLIAILEAIELLVEAGFEPRRTVLLAFGFDEEISGREGAGRLAPLIQERYGQDSIAVIVDEGAGFASAWGALFAMPGVAEKGATDVLVTVRMPGGHSSIPPDRTTIGVLSELVNKVEDDQYPACLDKANPYLSTLECGATHGPAFPKKLRKLLSARRKHDCAKKRDRLALEAARAGPDVRYLMQTSVAVDMISGGVKTNALPERATALINHRVNVGERSSDVHAKVAAIAKRVANKYNLTLHAFDRQVEVPKSIMLQATGQPLEPAPVTPTEAAAGTAFAVLSGTTRAMYGREVVVSPGIMTGNTDTRYYWNLTANIFRFSPGWDGESEGLGRIHTVNERVPVAMHVSAVRWFSLFIRNMDEAPTHDEVQL